MKKKKIQYGRPKKREKNRSVFVAGLVAIILNVGKYCSKWCDESDKVPYL